MEEICTMSGAIVENAGENFAVVYNQTERIYLNENGEKVENIVSFVMPTGYTFNLDGSTLYLTLTTLFCAQVAGIDLSFNQQILIMLTLMLTSKGVAGVPRVALVVLTGTLHTFGLPVEGVAIFFNF